MLLRTERLTKEFGGLTAVDEVDFSISENELCSIIGPNGAGKTTFFNLITGTLPPSEGTIRFRTGGDEVEITGWAPHRIAKEGIHRSYQITNIFPHSTVLENVRIMAQAHGSDSFKLWRNVQAFSTYAEEAYAILDRVGLSEQANNLAANLSHGEKRQLEIAIALAGDPDLLLLDEPNAGVSTERIDMVVDLIEDVATDHAILLVEHNMDIVMRVSDRIVVFNQGAVIADGPPTEVQGDPAVQEAYLGGYEQERGSVS